MEGGGDWYDMGEVCELMVIEVGGGEIGGGGGGAAAPAQSNLPQDNRTICDRLADDAQRLADEARSRYPNAAPAFVLQEFNKAFGRWTYGTYFAEGPLGGIDSVRGRLPVLSIQIGSRTQGAAPYRGQSGFARQFWEGDDPATDQVHHFGAYFSAGFAGHEITVNVHRALDDNPGDRNLGRQAQLLGRYLRHNPSQLRRYHQGVWKYAEGGVSFLLAKK